MQQSKSCKLDHQRTNKVDHYVSSTRASPAKFFIFTILAVYKALKKYLAKNNVQNQSKIIKGFSKTLFR